MKYIIPAQLVIIIFLAAFLFLRTDSMKELEEKSSKLKRSIKKFEHDTDSINTVVSLFRDSLNVLSKKIDESKAKVSEAHQREIYYKRKYENTYFVTYPTDSVRLRELAKYIPSVLSR